MRDETYPHQPGFKRPGTSSDAATTIAKRAPTLRARCLEVIRDSVSGLTADEVADILHATVLAVRPRVTELGALKQIEDSGVRRQNRSGKFAVVWRCA